MHPDRAQAACIEVPAQWERMAGLDGLRAMAVTAVVWHHAHGGYDGLAITQRGFLGVDVFFALSGYLITTLLLREQDRTGSVSLLAFYGRRALRIFPLYYAILLLLVMYFGAAGAQSQQRAAFFEELPFHLTYTSNFVELRTMMAITWSLSTEEQFYLLWPPVFVWLGRRSLPALGAFLLFNQAVNLGWFDSWLAAFGLPYAKHEILQCTFTPIVTGVLAAFAVGSSRGKSAIRIWTTPAALWSCLALLLLVASLPGDIRGWQRLAFQLCATALIVGVSVSPGHFLVRAFESPPLVHVGAVSYGMYLMHVLVLDFARRVAARVGSDSPEILFVGCLMGTILLATASFRWFESPLLKHKARFR